MKAQRFNSVWDALEDTTEEAANMKMRSVLMMAIERHVKSSKETQAAAAHRLGLTQPRLNDLLKGRIDKFSLDALVSIAVRAGMRPELKGLKVA